MSRRSIGNAMKPSVRPMAPENWPSVRDIFLEGIASGNATFETEAPGWEEWDQSHLGSSRLVAVVGSRIVGWAALSPVSHRSAYSGVAEVSVYVTGAEQGHGVGKALLNAIVEESERRGLWTLQASVFPDNATSIALHRTCGFRVIGRRQRIGRLSGIWRDVVLLERRSTTIGQD
jgi:L-amino acid N-acyltransferase YncA